LRAIARAGVGRRIRLPLIRRRLPLVRLPLVGLARIRLPLVGRLALPPARILLAVRIPLRLITHDVPPLHGAGAAPSRSKDAPGASGVRRGCEPDMVPLPARCSTDVNHCVNCWSNRPGGTSAAVLAGIRLTWCRAQAGPAALMAIGGLLRVCVPVGEPTL